MEKVFGLPSLEELLYRKQCYICGKIYDPRKVKMQKFILKLRTNKDLALEIEVCPFCINKHEQEGE